MYYLKNLLFFVALALLANAAQAGHSVSVRGSLLIQQDGYEIFLGAPLHRYSGDYTYRTPRFIVPHHRRHFNRGHHRIRDPLLHDYRRYRHQRHYNYRPHRKDLNFNRSHRSQRHFNRQHRTPRFERHLRRKH